MGAVDRVDYSQWSLHFPALLAECRMLFRNCHLNAVFFGMLISISAGPLPAAAAPLQSPENSTLIFEEHVAPILQHRCTKCHGDEQQESGLDLRRRFSMLAGGDSGPAIVPGKPAESHMLERISDGSMPPEGEPSLTAKEVSILRRWVAAGAATLAAEEPALPAGGAMPAGITQAARTHWAFQPVRVPPAPVVIQSDWIRTPIDAFVLAQLEVRGWQPAEAAEKATWLRRVCFDLTGLPPGPEEVAAFVGDQDPRAYETVVDRLLASPHYGERWAQHWLDVVRYAETEGFEYDRHLPEAWRFRDYVIESLNGDKPFDQFVREQIAGDEIRPDDVEYQTAAIFHRLGAVRRNAGNPEIALSRNEVLTERTNIIGEAFLGLTVGCARCHNHKLEPITQKDYYRLQAYLAATQEYNIDLACAEEKAAWDKQAEEIRKRITALKTGLEALPQDQKEKRKQQIQAVAAEQGPPPATIPSIRNEFDARTEIHVLRRGNWDDKGVSVGPRPLSVLVSEQTAELAADVTAPRSALADWLTGEEHPLTARVIANRIWQHHFGVGLVETANDFGVHGARPSHPELLDWLADSLVQNGWRMKPLHRLIVLSSTYRQSSQPASLEMTAADPANRLLSHFSRRRLSGEEIRDAMLAVSGRLNRTLHGPSVMIPVDQAMVDLLYNPTQWVVNRDAAEFDRRSVYLIAKRNLRLPFLETFDAPTLQTSCPQRGESVHAPQALELLNGDFANGMAAAFAERLRRECGDDPQRIVEWAFQLAAGRAPTRQEQQISMEFLADQPLEEFALAVLNLNDFVYVR